MKQTFRYSRPVPADVEVSGNLRYAVVINDTVVSLFSADEHARRDAKWRDDTYAREAGYTVRVINVDTHEELPR